MEFNATERQTRKMLVLKDVSKTMGERPLFAHLNLVLSPGMKLGLLGPNGSGKTTLIRLLTGELSPDAGQIWRAEGLRTVFFDQSREQLDRTQTLRRALAPSGDTVYCRGESMHVSAWARRFLFRLDQLDMPVSDLSGGEQSRILLAHMMCQPADLLILDEPGNDLDIPTLEILEESLSDFPGSLVLVTHDRFMLDRLSTELLALDGKGNARRFVDFAQWQAFGDEQEQKAATQKNGAAATRGRVFNEAGAGSQAAKLGRAARTGADGRKSNGRRGDASRIAEVDGGSRDARRSCQIAGDLHENRHGPDDGHRSLRAVAGARVGKIVVCGHSCLGEILWTFVRRQVARLPAPKGALRLVAGPSSLLDPFEDTKTGLSHARPNWADTWVT